MPLISPSQQSGFSLLELAIVLLILGILMSGVLVAVSETTENTRRTQTRQQLDSLREALYGFAQANGRLPCPALVSSDGTEARGATFDSVEGGICENRFGYIPAATIGFSGAVNEDGLLTDAWNQPIRYAVGHDSLTNATNLADLYPFEDTTTLFTIRGGNAEVITNHAASVLLSTGADGSISPPGSVNEDEYINGNITFISSSYSEENFDDIIIWMSPYILYNRLISAGRLP